MFSFRGLLDRVGAFNTFVKCCEATNSTFDSGCIRGKFWKIPYSFYCDLISHILFTLQGYSKQMEKQALHLPDTLMELLCVVVEFWCNHNFKLNQTLVEKGLKDLAEHFAVISQSKW